MNDAARIAYQSCPLCDTSALSNLRTVDCQGYPNYRPELPGSMQWRRCDGCAHVFTDGYFSDAARDILLSGEHASQQVGADVERNRLVWARIVDKITKLRDHASGCWLDVGFGNGSLMFTASEWGYEVVGVDLRPTQVDTMRAAGYEAHCTELTELADLDRFDVISMADVLEHIPFPRVALEHAHRLLRRGGLLFVSAPNADTMAWKALDDQNANPYWAEMEHYHNFGRANLYRLLDECGFEPVSYGVSERYRCAMEVVARRRPTPAGAQPGSSEAAGPVKVNLGCGRNILPGWVNLDFAPLPGVDVVANLDGCAEQPLPFADDSVDEFLLSHVLEHLVEPLALLQELHRIAKPETRAVVRVPYGGSDDAFEDPTHVHQYFLNSFGYFSQPFYWRADYGYRGDWIAEKITLLVDKKEHEGMSGEEILARVNTLRNVVKEMVVELVAVKPIRESRRELQVAPAINIRLA
jgi:predicted SAM-dependent methyltransferase